MNDDNEYVTKKYFKGEIDKFRLEWRSEFVDFEERLSISLNNRFEHYIKMAYELVREDFKSFFEMYKDIPKLAHSLRDKAEENEYEHSNFRMRIGTLERNQKKPKQK